MARGFLILVTIAGAIAGGWFAFAYFDNQRVARDLTQARADIAANRYASARKVLVELVKVHPDNGDALVLLGECEKAAGRFDAAIEHWKQVPLSSPARLRASHLAADELINSGRYADAEAILSEADLFFHNGWHRSNSADSYALLKTRARLYRFEGRNDDVRQVLREAILISPNPAEDLEELFMLDNSPMPVEALAKALAGANAEDPRVWLGRANLAILTGDFDAAGAWLAKCEARQPGDPQTREAMSRLAFAKDDLVEASRMRVLNPAEDPLRSVATHARLLLADQEDETARALLEGAIKDYPGATWAYERLAEIAARRQDTETARSLQRTKTTLDRAKDRYRELLLEGPLEQAFPELATLAEALGLRLESAAWRLLSQPSSDSWGDRAASLAGLVSPPRDAVIEGQTRLHAYLAQRLAATSNTEPSRVADRAAVPVFENVAPQVGLIFTYDNGATPNRLLPETMSGGLGVLDYDGDGWLDVFVVQGGALNDDSSLTRESDRLFRNKGDGTFEDMTERAGIAALPRGYGLAVTVGDYDNDGDPDLFLSRIRSYVLLRNRGDGTFEDITKDAGLDGVRDNPSSAAFADLDQDGDLDLYVCHYMKFDPDDPVICRNDKGEAMYCDPSKVVAAPDHLFRNDAGVFVDVTKEAGIVDENGRGLGVIASDFDLDGKVDLYVANDGTANFLFRNLGGMKFEEIALSSGCAGNAEGGYQASMGVACGDLDGDGLQDIVVTNFWGECSTLYHNLGGGLFTDWTHSSGLGQATRYFLGFGTAFFDYNNDGRLDLVTTNGHVNDGRPFTPYMMPPQLLANVGGGRLEDVGRAAGGVWTQEMLGRGLATGDFNNDGRCDVLIVPQAEPLLALRNETKGGNWLALRLVGGVNRDAVGARVVVKSGGQTQTLERFGGGSYQSAGDTRFLIGLGAAAQADSVEIHWPTGEVQTLANLAVNQGFEITQGREPMPLPGYLPAEK